MGNSVEKNNKRGMTMKKIVSLVLALVLLAGIIVPMAVNAEEISKEEVLFNKLNKEFSVFLDGDNDEIKELLASDLFIQTAHEIFMEGLSKNVELNSKLKEDVKVKEHITTLLTKENLTVLLSELKTGEADKSLVLLKTFIEGIEETLGEKWEDVIKLGSVDSAKDILADIETEVKEALKPLFSDIANHWSSDFIAAMVKEGVVGGYPDGSFKPNGLVTRAEFSKMIVSALKLDTVAYEENFTDVKANDWFASFVATMVKNGFVSGYPDGTFKPNGHITRNEMAKILSNVLEVEVTEEEVATILDSFSDSSDIPKWARLSVAEVVKAELIVGDTNKKFNPNKTATRAEAVTVVFRLFNR